MVGSGGFHGPNQTKKVAKTLVLATFAKKVGVLFENGGPPLHGFRGIRTSFSQMLLKPRFWQHFLGQNAIFHIKPMENQQFSSQRPSWPLLASPDRFWPLLASPDRNLGLEEKKKNHEKLHLRKSLLIKKNPYFRTIGPSMAPLELSMPL